MKALFLIAGLLCAMPSAFAADFLHIDGHKGDGVKIASENCDCPPDCRCHEDSGTCPGQICNPDCECDKGFYVHPAVKEAIIATESGVPLKGTDFIFVDGKKQFTGYLPKWSEYDGATFRSFSAEDLKAAGDPVLDIPEEYDMRNFTGAPMNRQGYNDCWAQSTAKAWGVTASWVFKIPMVDAAVSDVIDCSKNGSAERGGNIALNYVAKAGLAFTADYLYIARTKQCKDVPRHFKPREVGWVRGSQGKGFKLSDLQRAVLAKGALPVCGSASALKSGGWVEKTTSGVTNHCYVMRGWLSGKLHGKKPGIYPIMDNSWGPDWGDGGFGYYWMDEEMSGDVITEAGYFDLGEAPVRDPIVFELGNAVWTLKVTVQPSAEFTVDKAKKVLGMALEGMGQSIEAAKASLELSVKTLEGGI